MRVLSFVLGSALLSGCAASECEAYFNAVNECYNTYEDGSGTIYQGNEDFGLYPEAYQCSIYADPILGPLSDPEPFGCWTAAVNASDCTTDESITEMLEAIGDCF